MNSILSKLAVTLVDGGSTDVNIPTLSGDQVLHNALNITYSLGATVAIIVIIIGGITYATSAGDSANITKAKNMILYAVIGLGVVIAAFAITNFVIGRFT